MTDAAYVYTQDVRERSKIKTGALHKKNGSKSKKCTLPSDYLTPAKQKKLNGECHSIKMDEPFRDWHGFRKLPESMQNAYLNHLIDKYRARGCDLAKMFGVTTGNMFNYCYRMNPPVKFPYRGKGKHSVDPAWTEFIGKAEHEHLETIIEHNTKENIEMKEEVINSVVVDGEPIPVALKEEKAPYIGISELELNMTGPKHVILGMLETVLGEKCDYSIKINMFKT